MINKANCLKKPWYVGAQNDDIYIVAGRMPAINNDFTNHDAKREVIAKMYGDYALVHANHIVSLKQQNTELLAALKNVRLSLCLNNSQEAFTIADKAIAGVEPKP